MAHACGALARRQAVTNPKYTVFGRLIGRGIQHPLVQDQLRTSLFKVVAGPRRRTRQAAQRRRCRRLRRDPGDPARPGGGVLGRAGDPRSTVLAYFVDSSARSDSSCR